jgi:hypothetical protein
LHINDHIHNTVPSSPPVHRADRFPNFLILLATRSLRDR